MAAKLTIPKWLPPTVAIEAKKLFDQNLDAGNSQKRQLIERVANDPKMEFVWKELTKRRRGKADAGEYFHAADDISGDHLHYPNQYPNRTEWIRANALRRVFRRTIELGIFASIESAEKTRLETSARFEEHSAMLCSDADKAEQTYGGRPASRKHLEIAKALRDAAFAYRALAKIGLPFDIFKLHAMVFSRGLEEVFQEIFGKSLHGVIAILASTALGLDVTQSSVREWCRGPWGVTPRKRPRSP